MEELRERLSQKIPIYRATVDGFVIEQYGVKFEHLGDEVTKHIDLLAKSIIQKEIDLSRFQDSNSRLSRLEDIALYEALYNNLNQLENIGKEGNAIVTVENKLSVNGMYDFNDNEFRIQLSDEDITNKAYDIVKKILPRVKELPLQRVYSMRFLNHF